MCYVWSSDDNAHAKRDARIRFRAVSRETFPLNVKLPTRLRERARVMASAMRTTTTALIVQALSEMVEAYEAKRRADEESERREHEAKRSRRRGLGLELAPVPEELAPAVSEDGDASEEGDPEDEAMYVEQASRVMAVSDPMERRLAAGAAVKTIRDRHPLTSPPDHAIIHRLEATIVRLQASAPAPPAATPPSSPPPPQSEPPASLLERIFNPASRWINPASVKTYGAPDPVPDDDT